MDELSYLKSSPNLKKVYGLYKDFWRKEDEILTGKKNAGEGVVKGAGKGGGRKGERNGGGEEEGKESRSKKRVEKKEIDEGRNQEERDVIVMESEMEVGDCREVGKRKGRYIAEEIVHVKTNIKLIQNTIFRL